MTQNLVHKLLDCQSSISRAMLIADDPASDVNSLMNAEPSLPSSLPMKPPSYSNIL